MARTPTWYVASALYGKSNHKCQFDALQHYTLQVVAAPTGSGKTGVMELAILRLISVYIDQNNQFVLKPGSLKIVYLAPIRALVQEKVKQWQQSFGNKLGLTCSELTGDTDMADSLHLDNADIICTTPEKFGKTVAVTDSCAVPGCDTVPHSSILQSVHLICRCCYTETQGSRWNAVLQ